MALVEQFSDSFTYADGNLIANAGWEQHNTSASIGWAVDTNQAKYTLISARDTAQVAGVTFADDQYAKVDVFFGVNGAVNFNAGLGLRVQPQGTTQNMYRVILEQGSTSAVVKVTVSKYINGSFTNLATSTNEYPAANGDSLNLEGRISGDDITVYIDSTQVSFDTGSSVAAGGNFSSGVVGLDAFHRGANTTLFDNFSAGDITTGPSLTITDPIVPGTTTTFSTADFVDPLTGVRITDSQGNVKELTLASQTSVSAPAVGDLDYSLFGDVTIEVYNATESANGTTPFNPPAGFNQIALEAGFATDINSFLYQYGGTPAVPDQMAYDPIASDTGETLTLQTNGYWTATGYGEWTVHSIDATDGYMEPFQFIWKSGSTPGNIISMRARRLKARANTAKPLRAR